MSKEALFYTKKENGAVRCGLCPHRCLIPEGKRGFCHVRLNEGGTLMADGYGKCTSCALDPIEKKPLAYFHPGSLILSFGFSGCNMRCAFCQNYQISQESAPYRYITPEEAAALASYYKKDGNIGAAYTYNEPTTEIEWILETSALIHKAGMVNVMVTNGFIEDEPLEALLPCIDAWNIDLKAFHDDFYRKICAAKLSPVMNTIRKAVQKSHVEVTTLVIPGLNDSNEEIEKLSQFLSSISPDIPLHLTRYFPAWKMKRPPTPVETLLRLARAAGRHLHHVRIGNV